MTRFAALFTLLLVCVYSLFVTFSYPVSSSQSLHAAIVTGLIATSLVFCDLVLSLVAWTSNRMQAVQQGFQSGRETRLQARTEKQNLKNVTPTPASPGLRIAEDEAERDRQAIQN